MSTTTMNLFASMAKKVEKKSASKAEKPSVILEEAKHPEISKKLKRYAEVDSILKNAESEKEQLAEELKTIGHDVWMNLYEEKKVRPESFFLTGEKGGKLLFIMMDKYTTIPITEEGDTMAAQLKELYGNEIIHTTEAYKFDTNLLNKYQQALFEAITSIPDEVIPAEDKGSLILLEQKHSIAKGSIDRLMQYDEDKRAGFANLLGIQKQLKTQS